MKKSFWLAMIAVLLTSAVIVLPIINSRLVQSKHTARNEVSKSDKNIVERSEPDPQPKKDDDEKSTDESVTFLVTLKEKSLAEYFSVSPNSYGSMRDYILSESGKSACDAVKKSQAVAKASIKKLVPKSDLESSLTFSAVINGLTVKAPLSSMQKLKSINGVASVSVLYDDMFFMDDAPGEEAPANNEESRDEDKTGDESEKNDENGDDADPETAAARANLKRYLEVYDSLIGMDSEAGFTGSGMLISVIDSEFDVNNSVFARYPETNAVSGDIINGLYKNVRFNAAEEKGAAQVYVSPKIVFAYDYAENDSNTFDDSLFHGTAVASVAAGSTPEDEKLFYKGTAPEAQLALMKVSGGRRADGNIAVSTEALIAALDDSAKLGADVINLSLGSYDGIRNIDTLNIIFSNLSKMGVVVSGAAGNGGYNGYELSETLSTSDIFYSAENTLFEDGGAVTVGSVSVPITFRRYITIGEKKIYYTNLNKNKLSKIISYTELIEEPEESSTGSVPADESSDESSTGEETSVVTEVTEEPLQESEVSITGDNSDIPETSGDEPEKEPVFVQNNKYIYIDSFTAKEGFKDKEMTDKTLILNVGQTDDLDKAFEFAVAREISAILLVNGGTTDALKIAQDIPVVGLEGDIGSFLLQRPENDTFDITLSGDPVESGAEKSVTPFTSYCASDSQGIGARVVAPGENILAVPSRGEDAFISGTSSAAPCVSGAVTVIMQYLRELYPAGVSRVRLSHIAQDILMSSAQPIKTDGELYCSPRQQGFGLINLRAALTNGAYLTTGGDELTALELGDSENGEYLLTFTLTNISDEERTYTLSYALQTDKEKDDGKGRLFNTMKPADLKPYSTIQWFSDDREIDSLNLEAGESAQISAVLKINGDRLDALKTSFPCGFWLDGYTFVKDQNGAVLSLPFSGFFGTPESSPVFDSTIYDNEKSLSGLSSSYTAVGYKGSAYRSSELQLSGDRLLFSRDSIRCMEDDSSYSGAVILPDLYTLRDLYELTVRIYDASGKQLYSEDLGAYSSYRHKGVHPFVQLTDRTKGLREAFSKLTAGSYKYELSARTKKADGTLSEPQYTSVIFELDSKSPVIMSTLTHTEEGRIILELQASDENGINGFELYATAYDKKNDKYDYIDNIRDMINAGYIEPESCVLIEETDNDDGSYVFRYDITGLQGELRKLSVNTTTWQNKVSDQKIAYKAVDFSGNASSVRIADVIEYGTAEFVFVDQNGKPARGISVSIDGNTKTADKNGMIVFEGLEPDYYNARVTAGSEYVLEQDQYIVSIFWDALDYKAEQTVTFNGVYPEESGEESGEESEKSVVTHHAEEDQDKPMYALTFVGVMLLVSAAIFTIRKNVNKK